MYFRCGYPLYHPHAHTHLKAIQCTLLFMQDCKEFQGELFGISNLFRDLSDKLFTSEIIHVHDIEGNEHGPGIERGEKLVHAEDDILVLESGNMQSTNVKMTATSEADLEDLGMLQLL